jgi:ferric-dicitrate binding protein FerR (iron transport regulator)
MEQDEFIAALQRYLKGEATASERKLIDQWYNAMKGNVTEHDVPLDNELEEYYRNVIDPRLNKSNIKNNNRTVLWWYATGIAATILIALSFLLLYSNKKADENFIAERNGSGLTWKQITNTSRNKKHVKLPDSSKITLKPGGTLKYSSEFNDTKREIYLDGEADFDVTHNPSLPFLVYANEVTTRVLGTTFVIRAVKQEQRITVTVKSGKVSVYTNRDNKTTSASAPEIILTPNQQIVYDKKQHELSKTLVEKPRVIIPREEMKRMRFEEAPVSEIFKALEKAYGVDIEFDENVFSSCELTTVISDDDIYSRLDIICDALGTSYVREHDRIVISSSGCKTKF